MKKKEKKEPEQDEIKYKVINSFYSNSMGSGFSSDDFYIDFAQLPKDEIENYSNTIRIFSTPKFVKELVRFLKERLDNYEKEFGEIKLEDEKSE